MYKIRLKKGDTVKVLSGRDKGKTGKVVKADPKSGLVTVQGVNTITRHERPKRSRQKGQKVQVSMPMPASRVMLVCPSCGKPTRIGYEISTEGVKRRKCKKCQKTF